MWTQNGTKNRLVHIWNVVTTIYVLLTLVCYSLFICYSVFTLGVCLCVRAFFVTSLYLFSCAFVFNPNIARQHASHKESHTMQLLRKRFIRGIIHSQQLMSLFSKMRSVWKRTFVNAYSFHWSLLCLSSSLTHSFRLILHFTPLQTHPNGFV